MYFVRAMLDSLQKLSVIDVGYCSLEILNFLYGIRLNRRFEGNNSLVRAVKRPLRYQRYSDLSLFLIIVTFSSIIITQYVKKD